jgi:sec-independent protein translocase protein TatA
VFTGLESPTHLIIVLVIVLLLFGAKRVPELARGLGEGVREFRKGTRGEGDEDALETSDEREEGSDPR